MRLTRLVLLLLIVPLIAPAADAQPATKGDLAATDGEGDVQFGPQSPQPGFPPAMPSTVVTDYLDLVELKVYQETVDGIRIAVSLKTLEKPPFTLSNHQIEVRFAGQNSPPVSYSLTWNQVYFTTNGPTDDNNTPDMAASFCFYAAPEQTGSCLRQRVVGWMDFETNSLVAFIPKSSLLGIDPLSPQFQSPIPVTMGKGSRLSNFSVETFGDFWSDRLPNTGEAGPYTFQEPTANERLRVRLYTNETAPAEPTDPYAQYYAFAPQATDFPEVPVEPGAPFPVAIEIQNLNGAKRLVNITLEFLEPQDAPKWQLRMAPSLQIPGNDTRVINLLVNATSAVQHRDSALVRIVARSVGFADELGSQTIKLVATVPPNPTDRTLFFHAVAVESGFPVDTCNGVPFFTCFGDVYLNTVEEDPFATGDEQPLTGFTSIFSGGSGQLVQGSTTVSFPLEQALARDLVLDIDEDVVGEIQIGTSQPFDGTLEVNMRAGDLPIGSVLVPVTAAASQDPIPFAFLPLMDAARIPSGSVIGIEVRITYSYVGTSAALLVDSPGITPKGSFVTLPIIQDPRANNLSVAGENGLISLTVKGDRDDFVNPGESRAFNVTLVNEGADLDSINITGLIETGKCAIQIKPGQRFRLDGGDSARLGVLLRAHSEAKEGDRCQARIQATSETNPGAGASLLLEAIVTNGIDLADDSENYTIDAESAQKLERDQPNGTPGLGFASSILAAVGVFLYRRRRGGA